jgi:hypothetical protein
MPGSPFYSGLFEGFDTTRESRYQENLKAEADARAQEGNVYKYLLSSSDPKIQALAMSGLFESARPGSRAKGLKGFMGEVQGGEIYPQILSAMEEQVSDQAAPPAKPNSAALPSTTPVHGGPSTSFINPQGTEATAPGGFVSPRAAAGAGEGLAAGAMGGPAPEAPPGLAAPPAPVEHPTHRRGTGVHTAEEVAEATAKAGVAGKLSGIDAGFAGAPPDIVQRAKLGVIGAPMPIDRGAAGPLMADPNDPDTPIPTLRIGGQIVRADTQEPVSGLIGYVKPTTGGRVTKTMRDPRSSTGYSSVTYDATGVEQFRVPVEYNPPPAYGGTAVIDDPASPTHRSVAPINRGGGMGAPLAPAPAPEGQATADQAEAEGWVKAVAAKVREGRILPGTAKGAYDATTKAVTQGKYQTYEDLQKAAQKSGGVGATDTRGSVADRVAARLRQNQQGFQGAPPPAAPARARGAGPVQ